LRQRGLTGFGVNAYPCDFCGGWHIGRTGRKEKRGKLWEINQKGL
jgi:hypothetical protein